MMVNHGDTLISKIFPKTLWEAQHPGTRMDTLGI
jgi:hypothetical protein